MTAEKINLTDGQPFSPSQTYSHNLMFQIPPFTWHWSI